MMESLEREMRHWRVWVTKHHLCCCFSNFPPLRGCYSWWALPQTSPRELSGDSKTDGREKIGRHFKSFYPNTLLHFACNLVLELKSNCGKTF